MKCLWKAVGGIVLKSKAKRQIHFRALWMLKFLTQSRTASQEDSGSVSALPTFLPSVSWFGHSCGRWDVDFGALHSHNLYEVSYVPVRNEMLHCNRSTSSYLLQKAVNHILFRKVGKRYLVQQEGLVNKNTCQ